MLFLNPFSTLAFQKRRKMLMLFYDPKVSFFFNMTKQTNKQNPYIQKSNKNKRQNSPRFHLKDNLII